MTNGPIVLGAGLAGLSTALGLVPRPVTLVAPFTLGEECSSAWAQGGIAAAVGKEDNPEDHAKDTLNSGNGLNDEAIVRQTTGDAHAVIERLTNYGVAFDRDAEGDLLFGLEAAHGRNRIVHAKDATGHVIIQALVKKARATPSIKILENTSAVGLRTENGRVSGVVLRHNDEETFVKTTCAVLATGGATALWRDTTNPHGNWGSGLGLAARAGATLGDLEFMQFHPTAIDIGRDPMPLASETLRGEGAVLIDENGKRFTDELQVRDIVARAIWDHMAHGHKVFLDARKALGASFSNRFPTIYALCASGGIDPATTPIPVRPAAHYHMGGILTDNRGRTDVEGLWACGEAACTGLHGANRLASNSLLEAASFGWRAAKDIEGFSFSERNGSGIAARKKNRTETPDAALTLKIRSAMSDLVGVVRDADGLKRAIALFNPLARQYDIALAGLMIAQCALRREESRGAHYRSDFPKPNATGNRSHFRLSDLETFQ